MFGNSYNGNRDYFPREKRVYFFKCAIRSYLDVRAAGNRLFNDNYCINWTTLNRLYSCLLKEEESLIYRNYSSFIEFHKMYYGGYDTEEIFTMCNYYLQSVQLIQDYYNDKPINWFFYYSYEQIPCIYDLYCYLNITCNKVILSEINHNLAEENFLTPVMNIINYLPAQLHYFKPEQVYVEHDKDYLTTFRKLIA
jgi:5'-3' exonuclease